MTKSIKSQVASKHSKKPGESQGVSTILSELSKLEEDHLGLEPRLFDDMYYDEQHPIKESQHGKTKGQKKTE
jgi:hypothetical protein